jgi:predicted HTH domain antitoxin
MDLSGGHGRQPGRASRARSLNSERSCARVYNCAVMGVVQVELDQDLVDLLEELHRPVKQAARELIVLELYRQGEISSGKAAELLGLGREQFIRQASERGIPYFQLDGEDLQRELDASKKL